MGETIYRKRMGTIDGMPGAFRRQRASSVPIERRRNAEEGMGRRGGGSGEGSFLEKPGGNADKEKTVPGGEGGGSLWNEWGCGAR